MQTIIQASGPYGREGNLMNAQGESALVRRITVSDLRDAAAKFEGEASEIERAALAKRFDLVAVNSLSYELESVPWRGGVKLSGVLQAVAVQNCVVTLDPVTEEINEEFQRGFLPFEDLYPDAKPGFEHEIAIDSELGEVPELLTDPLDIGEIVAETLGVSLDPYPRSEAAGEASMSVAPPGVAPITDADMKPFASLEALRKKMESDGSGD